MRALSRRPNRRNRRKRRKRRKTLFSLIEVLVAVAILAMGMVTTMGLAASSSMRMKKAVQRWENKHMLAQAIEYYLLTDEKNGIPEEFFPYENYTTQVTIETPDELPEGVFDYLEADERWRLVKVVVKLFDESGEEVESIQFDRIIYEDNGE